MQGVLRNNHFRVWLALIGAVTLMAGTVYGLVQQSTRLAADDLPLATAQRAKQELESGIDPTDVDPELKVDIKNNINPFVIVTDNSYHVIVGSAILDNKTPLPPKGVFEFTKKHGEDRFTWEPAKGVRLATVVVPYKDGFIIAGQSLTPTEERVQTYTAIVVAGWLTTLVWISVVLLMPRSTSRSKK